MTVRGSTLRQNPAYRPGDSHPLWRLAAILLLAMGGCRTSVPRQPIVPVESPAPVPAAVVPSRWVIARDFLSREYIVEQSAALVITTDSGTVSDSTGLSITATVRQTPDGGVAGLVRSAILHGAGGATPAIPGLTLPMAFAGTMPAPGLQHQLVARGVPPDPCQGPASSILGSIRDLVASVPDTLVVGRTWTDSGSVPTCRAGARLLVQTTRSYRVRAHETRGTRDVLLVDRRSVSRLGGSAARGSDTTVVEGQGSGSAELVLDAKTGAVVALTGTTSLDLTVRGATRSERARQLLRTRVVQPGS